MSRANSSRSAGSSIAAPPYLTTIVRPWNSRMYGQRLEERRDVAVRLSGVMSSRRVFGVDADVLVPEVAEEDLGLEAVAGQADHVLDLGALHARGEIARRRAPIAWPATQTCTPSIATSTGSGAASTSAMPTACTIRPQFGSPPCSAVLTSGELATARAVRSTLGPWPPRTTTRPIALAALAVAHDRERQLAQQRVQRLAEAPLAVALRLDVHAAGAARDAGSPCRSWRAGRRRRCGRSSACTQTTSSRSAVSALSTRVGLHEAEHRREARLDHPGALGLRGQAHRAARAGRPRAPPASRTGRSS